MEDQKRSFWTDQKGRRSFLLALFGCVLYPIIMNYLGFFLSSVLFLFFLLGVIAREKWWAVLAVGAVATGATYLIMGIWLRAYLPKGVIGF